MKNVLDLLRMLNEAYTIKQFFREEPVPQGPFFLSLQLAQNSFMYAVSTDNFSQVIELGHVAIAPSTNQQNNLVEQLSSLIRNYSLDRKKFEKVEVAFLGQDFNLVPQAFTGADNLKPLLKFTTGLAEIKTASSHQVKGVSFCYTIRQDLLNYIEKTFVNASIRYAGAVNINLLFSQHSLSDKDLLLNINEGVIEIVIKNKDALQFYNLFNYHNDEDVLYYLLFTMEQFNLNPLHVKLAVAGQKAVTDELIKNIKKYIKYVSFAFHDREISLHGELKQLPGHYYFTLLNQHTCEL